MPVETEDVDLIELEDQRTEDDEREVAPLRYAISSYGADYPVDGLVKRLREGSIVIPEFQRGFVWDVKDASRFVESLLLGLPVPSIFLSKEPDSKKLLVVDGQQRLHSLRQFYDGVWRPNARQLGSETPPSPQVNQRDFKLKGVQKELEGLTYSTLRDEDKRVLDDAILHAMIFQQDEPSDDESGVYEVFQRLNSGGKKLTPQEVRSAVHHQGQMRKLLAELNKYPAWRSIYGADEDTRMRDQELILRFLALLSDGDQYTKPMADFLNKFMGRKKSIPDGEAVTLRESFCSAVDLVQAAVGDRAFRPARALNAAVFDAVMVGTARRLREGAVNDIVAYKAAYDALLANEAFLDACGRGTASGERVRTRLTAAQEAFRPVP
jgi:hypothetical protein